MKVNIFYITRIDFMNVDFQYNKFIIHNIHHVIEYLLKLNYLIFFFFYFLFRNIYLYILPPFYFHIIFRVIEITIDNSRHLYWNRKEFNNSIDIASSVKIVHPTTIRYLARLHYFLVQNPRVKVH